MKVEKKEIKKSQIELVAELSVKEFEPYIKKGAEKVSEEVKIDGFRKGKVPYEILRQKIGDMTILEEAARLAINKLIGDVIKDNIDRQTVGQPKVDIVKLAPENPLIFKVNIDLIPEIKLGTYKDLKIKKQKIEVDEKELEKSLNELREMRVKEVVVNREIKKDDKALIDIQMFQDNVPIEGGQGKDAVVIVGKDYIIPGFDKNLIGGKKGDVKKFELPYPKDYHMKNLAGKMVDFKVTIKDVYEREMPKLDDELAKTVGLKKLDELKDNIKKSILSQKEKEVSVRMEKEMFEKIITKTKFDDIPEVLIQHEGDMMIRELEHTVTSQGAKFEDYLKSINKTMEQLKLDLMPEAIKRVKVSLLIREISKEEKIKASEKDIEKHVEEMKKNYKEDKQMLTRIDSLEYKEYAANTLTSQKIVDELKKWNMQ